MGSKPRSVWATKVMALGLDSAWFGDRTRPAESRARPAPESGPRRAGEESCGLICKHSKPRQVDVAGKM